MRSASSAILRVLDLHAYAVRVADVHLGRARRAAAQVRSAHANLDPHRAALLTLRDTVLGELLQNHVEVEPVETKAQVIDSRCPLSARWIRREPKVLRSAANLQRDGHRALAAFHGQAEQFLIEVD